MNIVAETATQLEMLPLPPAEQAERLQTVYALARKEWTARIGRVGVEPTP